MGKREGPERRKVEVLIEDGFVRKVDECKNEWVGNVGCVDDS